jgi:hypothetical protein
MQTSHMMQIKPETLKMLKMAAQLLTNTPPCGSTLYGLRVLLTKEVLLSGGSSGQ